MSDYREIWSGDGGWGSEKWSTSSHEGMTSSEMLPGYS
jgi:hypothetical protein